MFLFDPPESTGKYNISYPFCVSRGKKCQVFWCFQEKKVKNKGVQASLHINWVTFSDGLDIQMKKKKLYSEKMKDYVSRKENLEKK